MKKIFLLTLLTVLGMQTASNAAEQLDQIVAVVNDDVVTRSELNQNLGIIKVQMAQQNMPVTNQKELAKQALNQLIDKKLQLQIAKQAGITITDADITRAVGYIAKQNNMTVSDLYARINHDGMSTADYKKQMREQIAMQKLQQQQVGGHITVSQDEINTLMRSHVWQNTAIKEYRVEDVLIPLPESPSATELATAKKEAETIVASMKQQNEPSDANAQTTDLGWRKIDEIPALFTKQLATMQAHDVSAPITAPNGLHVIRLTDVRSAGASIDENAGGPTREQAENILMQRKFAEAVQNWVAKQRSQAFVQTNMSA